MKLVMVVTKLTGNEENDRARVQEYCRYATHKGVIPVNAYLNFHGMFPDELGGAVEEECTDEYVAYAMEQIELARQNCKDPVVLIEQHLDYSAYVPEGFGTGDLVIVADGALTVIDLKYGKGVAIEAEWNPQMMLYGLGALELFDAIYDIDTVRMTIYQPRLESISTWEISVSDLMGWVETELRPKAALAIHGRGGVSVRLLVPVLQGEEYLQGEGGEIPEAGADGVSGPGASVR